MVAESVDEILETFRSRAIIKGSSKLEKLNNLLQRWEKVIEDCEKSHDSSGYRIQFCEAHKFPITALKKILSNQDLNLKDDDHENKIISDLRNRFLFYLRQETIGSGGCDALCFIVCELDSCL